MCRTFMPSCCSVSASISHCVDFPALSRPSNTMSLPRAMVFVLMNRTGVRCVVRFRCKAGFSTALVVGTLRRWCLDASKPYEEFCQLNVPTLLQLTVKLS